MAEEIIENPALRVVRSDEQGAYLVQIGLDGCFRTVAAFKLGKFDQLRAAAKAKASASQSETPQ